MKKLAKRWFWSNTIRTVSVIFTYIMIAFAIASLVNGMVFAIAIGSMLAFYPLWTLVFLFYYRMSLINRTVLETYWALYGNLKYKQTTALLYPFLSISRKALFVFGAIYLEEWSYFQVQLFTLLNIFYSLYFAGSHPNSRKWDFRLEIFNEWGIQILCFHLMCFTDMVQLDTEPFINYKLGQSFKYLATFMIFVNLFAITVGMIRPVKHYLRKERFRKLVPTLIEQRMKERDEITRKAHEELEGKINVILTNYQKNQMMTPEPQDHVT